ncbi:MAG TPA: hypothetical protein VFA60_00845 [Terriglobales bacterium]|nr:hypothetical protein [Terriglobales bacterium]
MMKRTFAWGLSLLLFHTVLAADAFAVTSTVTPPTRQAIKVAAAVQRIGSGEYSLVALRLHNRAVIKGYVSEIGADSFTVTDNDSGIEHRVPYSTVARLQGMNLVSGTQAGIGGGFRAGVARVAGFLLPIHTRPVNNLTTGEKTLLIGIGVGILLAIILAKAL